MTKQMSIGDFFGFNPDPRSVVEHPDIRGGALVGVEVELENIPPEYIGAGLKYWSVKNDGSLRNNGAEFVFKQPLGGADVVSALEELEKFIKNKKIKPDLSDRTSVHVHVDVRDMDDQSFKNFILMYATFEKPLFKYAGEDRYDNIFCVPFGNSRSEVHNLSRIVSSGTGKDPDMFHISLGDAHKYTGCNVAAVRQFGSVEFRIHKGEWGKDSLLSWINILLSIRNAATNHELSEEITKRGIHVYTSESGPLEFAHAVFGEENLMKMMYGDIEHDIIDGARLAQDIIFAKTLQGKRKHSDSVGTDSDLFQMLRKKHIGEKKNGEFTVEELAAAYGTTPEVIRNAMRGDWEYDPDFVENKLNQIANNF